MNGELEDNNMLTIDQLYESYMDTGEYAPGEGEFGTPFAEDVWAFFGGADTGWSAEDWAADYGMYLPSYDPTQVELAGRVRDLDQEKALDVLNLTKQVTDRVYNTELDTLSTQLGTEMKKAKDVAGGLGLRSGTLESAVEGTMAATGSKVKDLGDRMMLQSEKDENAYAATVVDSALDFDKAEHQSKKELYDRTLAAINRLTQIGAFEKKDCTDEGLTACPEGTSLEGVCVENPSTDCSTYDPGGTDLQTWCMEICMGVGQGCQEVCGATGFGFNPAIDFGFTEEEATQDECIDDAGHWICGEDTGGGCPEYFCSMQDGVCMNNWEPYGPCTH